ncbi:MAG: cob(I)yrinic acid a,c-diamide adenosyltransferase [Firmicutes bacterium]|nr:cob(I)yrinic acid a,c-diamide adenosyltransferase [Bacillota bacterium]
MLGKGYVHVYTGNGKGKTTAMLGLSLRAAGAGLNVYIGQFIKSMAYSEVNAIKSGLPNIEIEQYGDGCMITRGPSPQDIMCAEAGIDKAMQAMLSGKYNVIALDEINVAVHLGVVKLKDALELIAKKPHGVELILTGRYAPPEIVALADVVSEIVDIKHYYFAGVMARDGIER